MKKQKYGQKKILISIEISDIEKDKCSIINSLIIIKKIAF